MSCFKRFLPTLILPLVLHTPLTLADSALEQARASFEQSLLGDKAQTEPAIKAFTELHDANPENPLYLAYLGSAESLKGRDVWMPWNKMKWVEKGLDRIDEAVAELPVDSAMADATNVEFSTRLVAISTFLAVPDFLNRFQAGKDLYEETMAEPGLDDTPAEIQARLLIQGALIAQKEDQPELEKQRLQQALSLGYDGAHTVKARERLQALEPGVS